MITLKNIKTILKQFATNHGQVREINRGTAYDVDEVQVVDGIQMFWNIEGVAANDNGATWNLVLFFMEQVTQINDASNTENVMNECALVCSDVINYLDAYNYAAFSRDMNVNVELNKNWTINTFEERFNSLYSGAFVNLQLNAAWSYNNCKIPMTSFSWENTERATFTFSNLISVMNELGDKHDQIRETERGTIYDIDEIQTMDGFSVYWNAETASANGFSQTWNVSMYVFSQVTEVNDLSNAVSVMNDATMIASDFLSFFDLNFELNKTWGIQPIEYRFNSLYSGAELSFQINTRYNYDRCDLPLNPEGIGFWRIEQNFEVQ